MTVLDDRPTGEPGQPRSMMFMCPVGPHMYEAIGDPELGHEELDTVKCEKHDDADVKRGIA